MMKLEIRKVSLQTLTGFQYPILHFASKLLTAVPRTVLKRKRTINIAAMTRFESFWQSFDKKNPAAKLSSQPSEPCSEVKVRIENVT